MVFFNDFSKVSRTFRWFVDDWKKTYFIAGYLLVTTSVKFLEQVYPNQLSLLLYDFSFAWILRLFFQILQSNLERKRLLEKLQSSLQNEINQAKKQLLWESYWFTKNTIKCNEKVWEKTTRFYGNHYQITARTRNSWKRGW